MARAKQASKRNRRRKALPVLGFAGVSFTLAGAASASTGGPATDVQAQNFSPSMKSFSVRRRFPT